MRSSLVLVFAAALCTTSTKALQCYICKDCERVTRQFLTECNSTCNTLVYKIGKKLHVDRSCDETLTCDEIINEDHSTEIQYEFCKNCTTDNCNGRIDFVYPETDETDELGDNQSNNDGTIAATATSPPLPDDSETNGTIKTLEILNIFVQSEDENVALMDATTTATTAATTETTSKANAIVSHGSITQLLLLALALLLAVD